MLEICPAARVCGRPRWPRSWASHVRRCERRYAGCRRRDWSSSRPTAARPCRSSTSATCATPGRRESRWSRAPRGWQQNAGMRRRSRGCAGRSRRSAPAGDDREAGYAANREFHLALAAASGNPHLTRFAEMLWVPRIGVPIYEAQAGKPAGTLAWAEEHERITDAVAAGDAGLAEHLTRTHVAAHPPVGSGRRDGIDRDPGCADPHARPRPAVGERGRDPRRRDRRGRRR